MPPRGVSNPRWDPPSVVFYVAVGFRPAVVIVIFMRLAIMCHSDYSDASIGAEWRVFPSIAHALMICMRTSEGCVLIFMTVF